MPVLSDSEERLLAFVREGRVDAEIAVRLGVSTGEVRQRVQALAAKLGVKGKAELAASHGQHATPPVEAPEFVPRRRSQMPARAAVACVIFGGVSLFALGMWLGRSSADEGARGVTAASTGSPAAVVTQPPPTIPPPQVRTVDGVASRDLGQLLSVPGHVFDAIVDIDQRETLTVVTLNGAGLVHLQGTYLRALRNGSSYAETTAGTPVIAIWVFPADQNTELIPIDGGVAVYTKGEAPPRLFVWAMETRGPFGDTRGMRQFRATVDSTGELFVSVDPVSQRLAIDGRTGAALNLSHTQRIGSLSPLTAWNLCDPGTSCKVRSNAGLFAPFDGVARCSNGSLIEYDDPVSGVRLVFEPGNGESNPACPPSPQALRVGDMLAAGWHMLRAVDAAGQPLGLAVAGDGSLYAGDIVPTKGCPCLSGN